jgi:spore maturation protein CgeB
MTVHVPRRFYAEQLAGIPTIRVFEALACGIPLICAPWRDIESLFHPGADYLSARNPSEMTNYMRALQADGGLRRSLATHGLQTIRARHTCAHRVDQLLGIVRDLSAAPGETGAKTPAAAA